MMLTLAGLPLLPALQASCAPHPAAASFYCYVTSLHALLLIVLGL
jgi:hypothetical protein